MKRQLTYERLYKIKKTATDIFAKQNANYEDKSSYETSNCSGKQGSSFNFPRVNNKCYARTKCLFIARIITVHVQPENTTIIGTGEVNLDFKEKALNK